MLTALRACCDPLLMPCSEASSYENRPVPGGAHGDLVVDGWFNAACYFGEGGKDSCLPDECSETELVVSAPFFQSDKLLFSVDPEGATPPGRCAEDDRRRLAANNEDAAAKTDPAAKSARPKAARAETANVQPGTPTTYYEGRGNVYAGAGTLYSRSGPFKGQPKSTWFQYAWARPGGSYRSVTNAGGRTVYTPWTYTIDFPAAAGGEGGKDEYERY
jgi:hypothetical protein